MKKLEESMGSINVEQIIDISRIRKLAGLANSSTATGTPVVAEEIYDKIDSNAANELADELEEQIRDLSESLEIIESTIKNSLPAEFRSMENYTLAHMKSLIGGHGYAEDRMSKSLSRLVEELRDHGFSDSDQ